MVKAWCVDDGAETLVVCEVLGRIKNISCKASFGRKQPASLGVLEKGKDERPLGMIPYLI